ncbi:Crp/Fnr family transcriptional regulator [Novosphingobium decolorationis]|uniref:Crp/Fnr family transcriptional regulator n=1 Tax=Novosphingobium decolorationis TaxID=2698673 RepID=A0ABX8EAY4_9SPHN|nr:Crp/Fnr family transcriptional regulator [Novosphingobium decolorationis]QVM86174.1 Crp/Fnr family transcriptional regulator [Novosphingobium decolorationis]
MDAFLANRRDVVLSLEDRALLETAIAEVREIESRQVIVPPRTTVEISTLLIEGLVSRFIDDRHGLRQLVAVHVPGEFVDLHAYPMRELDHGIGALTPARVAIVPHDALRRILDPRPELARKLWFSTLLDAALHRAWLFRVGRLDAVGRVAHFLSEMNLRLQAIGLSDGMRFALPLTQADIAEICGLTTVHTNRALRQLREAGLCEVHAPTVELLDPTGLARRGNFNSHYLYLDTEALMAKGNGSSSQQND